MLADQRERRLDEIAEVVKNAGCPEIADVATEDDAFTDDAAKHGIFA